MNQLIKAPVTDFAAMLTALVKNPDLSADKMEVAIRMRREVLDDMAREAYDAALSALQAELPQVSKMGSVELKSKTGGNSGGYKFARWEDMDKVLRPLLAKHGFALSFTCINRDDGKFIMRAMLSLNGYSRSFDSVALPPDIGPGRNGLQAAGSAQSYGKRYAAENALNIVRAGDDDDAVAAAPQRDAPITLEQLTEISELLKDTGSDTGKFLQWAKVRELGHVRQGDFKFFIKAIRDDYKKRSGGQQ